MYCQKCGQEIQENEKMCSGCQTAVVTTEETETAKEQQAPPNVGAQENTGKYNWTEENKPPEDVDFIGAVKNYFTFFANFKGRSSKSEYWWAFLFNFIIGLVLSFIPVVGLLLIVPSLANCVRRFHDIGKSGWCALYGLIPIAGFIVMIVMLVKDSDDDNCYGPAK